MKLARKSLFLMCLALVLATVQAGNLQAAYVTEFIWSGAVTHNSVQVNAKTLTDSTQVRLIASTSDTLSDPVYSEYSRADLSTNHRVTPLSLSGLRPDTPYFYGIEVNGRLGDRRGRFRTFPKGAGSFKFVFSGCAGDIHGNKGGAGSNHPVFRKIQEESALFYLCTGDIHYSDIAENNRNLFRAAFDSIHAAPNQRILYESTPLVYIWDDHDYGKNNSDKTSPSRNASRLTYQEYVPHYPLAAGSGDVPIYQSFTLGRTKFILTDQRSLKAPGKLEDNAAKSVLGAEQKQWLKNQLLDGRDNHKLTVWISTFPWIAAASAGADHWGGYATERQELADFIKTRHVDNLIMLSGDAHMIAADDGSHNKYAKGSSSFPVFHAAALQRKGSRKGGPYSEGTFPNPDKTHGQYGIIEVEDTGGDTIRYTFTGKRVTAEGNVSTVLTYSKP